MNIAKRIFFFMMVNLLVMASLMIVLSVVLSFLPPEYRESYYNQILIFAVIFGFGGAFVSLLLSKFMAKSFMGVQIVETNTTNSELQWLVQTTHRLARRAGLSGMPEVGVYNSPEVNAFATGATKNNALVAVSTGLLRQMNQDEVEGVIGHEVAHIANGDMVTMTLVQGVVNTVVILLAQLITNLVESYLKRDMGFFMRMVIYNVIYNILAFAAFPFVAAVSRWREYRADAGGAKLAGRDKMLAGLQRLQAQLNSPFGEEDNLEESHASVATLKISSRPKGFLSWWQTHPPIEDRIRRLQLGRY